MSEEGMPECLDCSVGKASAKVKRTNECDLCVAGQSQPNEGTTACLNCIPGRYQMQSEQIDCVDCPKGRASAEVAHGTECEICLGGRYQPYLKATGCLNCIPGRQQPAPEQIDCVDCEKDTYAAKAKQNNCETCVVGKYAEAEGSASCQSCGAGSFGIGCKACPIGWARPASNIDVSKCVQCGKGETTPKEGSASCSSCDLGKYGSSKGHCSACPPGQYQDGKGETTCKECDADAYLTEQGKFSKADCTACSEDRSTGTTTGNTEPSACRCKRTDYYQTDTNDCETCPLGADCSSKDGILLSQLTALPGHWRPTATSPVFSACKKGHRGLDADSIAKERCCPGETCTQKNISNATADAQCLLGYAGPLCLVCATDHVSVGGACVFCPGGASFALAIIPIGSVCFVFFLFVVFFLICSTGNSNASGFSNAKKFKRAHRFMGQFKILLSFLQIFSTLPNVLDTVPWPIIFLQIARPLGIFNLDFLSIFAKTSCGVNVRFFDRFVLHMMLPVIVVATVLAALGVARMCTSKAKKEKLIRINETTSKIAILVMLLLFPGLSTKIFQMMKCISIDGIDGALLVEDYSVVCHQGEHVGYSVLAGVFLCVYVIGIPLVMFLLLWWNRNHLHDVGSAKHSWVNAALGTLFLQCKWNELVLYYLFCSHNFVFFFFEQTNLNIGGLK